ncbi:MAG: hypothetical protein FJ247_10280 [Nitrospira sp.]|nr:hypothetical protein [Nitrospira sp.]
MVCKIARSLALLTALVTVSPTMGWTQVPPGGERFSLVLSGDPFKWEQSLNEAGQKGWDALMAQQPAVSGLMLHFVIFTGTPAVKSVDYKVVVAEFSAEGDVSSREIARSQLEVQANAYGRNGWALLQALTGQHAGGKPFIALILKKPIL